MKYKTEKEILVEKIEEIIVRETGIKNLFSRASAVEGTTSNMFLIIEGKEIASKDPEVCRLYLARRVLLGETVNPESTASSNNSKSSQEVVTKVENSIIDKFALAAQVLNNLKNETDQNKINQTLIESNLWLLQIVAALCTNEASKHHNGSV